jgi:hypothetical protein
MFDRNMGSKGSKRGIVAVAAILIVAIIAGCGGGSSATDASAALAGGSPGEFMKPGSKANKYAQFGREASDEQREAASIVLKRNFQAREHANFRGQCASLSEPAVKRVEEEDLLIGVAEGCVAAVKLAAEPLSKSAKARRDTLAGPIDVLRIKGKQAYALFHGNDGKDYEIPMELVGRKWQVGALATIELP